MEYYKINPGGNITAIVTGVWDIRERANIVNTILHVDTEIEQVGFWVTPRNKEADARIEMMGGEFCGNASRCLAFLYSLLFNKKSVSIECSGFPTTIQGFTTGRTSAITVPKDLFQTTALLNNPLISMPGIRHLILDRYVSKEEANEILQRTGLINKDAAGVIGVTQGESINIYPYVWVRATKTFYAETACGSGTLAAALALAGNSTHVTLNVIQPSLARYTVSIDKHTISLSGPIIQVIRINLGEQIVPLGQTSARFPLVSYTVPGSTQ